MTDRNRGGGSDEHPEILPWLASGGADAAAAADVMRHVERCAECAREIEALRSLGETMRRHDRSDHIPIPDLVALEGDEPPPSGATAAALMAHLEGCATCAEELAELRRVRDVLRSQPAGVETSKPARPVRRPDRRVTLLALAAAALAVTLGLSLVFERGVRPGSARMAALETATFSPAVRGSAGGPRLEGPGPWAVIVLLPLAAEGDRYTVSVARADGTAVRGLEIDAAAARQGTLSILLPPLGVPGDYVLKVRAAAAPISESIDYPFTTSR